jgi:hypothetical protein
MQDATVWRERRGDLESSGRRVPVAERRVDAFLSSVFSQQRRCLVYVREKETIKICLGTEWMMQMFLHVNLYLCLVKLVGFSGNVLHSKNSVLQKKKVSCPE